MPFEIKIRLIRLNKKQKDLLFELRNRNIKINPPYLSNILSGVREGAESQMILKMCDEIVTEWERKLLMGK
jgi:hypothetical protein